MSTIQANVGPIAALKKGGLTFTQRLFGTLGRLSNPKPMVIYHIRLFVTGIWSVCIRRAAQMSEQRNAQSQRLQRACRVSQRPARCPPTRGAPCGVRASVPVWGGIGHDRAWSELSRQSPEHHKRVEQGNRTNYLTRGAARLVALHTCMKVPGAVRYLVRTACSAAVQRCAF